MEDSELFNNTVMLAMKQQRDNAMDIVAQLNGQIAVLNAKIQTLTSELEKSEEVEDKDE